MDFWWGFAAGAMTLACIAIVVSLLLCCCRASATAEQASGEAMEGGCPMGEAGGETMSPSYEGDGSAAGPGDDQTGDDWQPKAERGVLWIGKAGRC